MKNLYKCLIADDSMLDLDALAMYVSKIETLTLVGSCSDGLEASKILAEQEVDIVFSDIDMPDLSGIDLLKSLKAPPVFVFISSHAEHAAESFNLDVIDFVTKPITLARLIKATNKAIDYIELKKNTALSEIPNVTEGSTLDKTADHFYIKENYDLIKLLHVDVAIIESMGDFSIIHSITNKKHITLVSLKNIELQLAGASFLRVHRQFIINLNHLLAITADNMINLTGGHQVPISISYKNNLLDIINSRVLLRGGKS